MIKEQPLIYLASPYSHQLKQVQNQRAEEMQDIMARIINEQDAIVPYSPIVSTHPLDARCPDHDWITWDFQYLIRCDGMIVVKQPGWDISLGIKKELNFCFEHRIPYAYAYPEDILEVCRDIVGILK